MKGRFLIEPPAVGQESVLLDAKETRHAVKVLRIQPGNLVELLDGKGHSYRGIVAGLRKERLLVTIDPTTNSTSEPELSPVSITLAISVIKPERMEFLIQKACELGISKLVPLLTERCVVRLSKERWAAKLVRWRKIASESCKQCGQTKVPEITPLENYQPFLSTLSKQDALFIPTLAVKGESFYQALKNSPGKQWVVLIGPEGDFTKREVEQAIVSGAKAVTLGSLVLRSETAAIYALSVLNFFHRECQHQ